MGSENSRLDERLSGLAQKLDAFSSLIQGNCVLLDYPVHANVGDHLIWQGEREFLRKHKIRVIGQYSIHNIGRKALNDLERCDTILFHGGGNFGDIWPAQQAFREQIIVRYPEKRIVFLPQTVHYSDETKLNRAAQIISSHKDVHVLVRDRVSFELLNRVRVKQLSLCPDMAHALYGVLRSSKRNTIVNRGTLTVLRNDRESSGRVAAAAPEKEVFDWDCLLEGSVRAIYKVGCRVVWSDRRFGNRLPAHMAWNFVSQTLIQRAEKVFGPYREIETDRLHAMILAALLGKRVSAYDNSYGKVSGYLDCWLSGLEEVTLSDAEPQRQRERPLSH